MSKYTKKKTTEATINVAPEATPSSPSYGFVIVREYPGWRTKMIKMCGDCVEVLEVTEPDTKANAIFQGERFLNAKTA